MAHTKMTVTTSAGWSHCFDLGRPRAVSQKQVSIQLFPDKRWYFENVIQLLEPFSIGSNL